MVDVNRAHYSGHFRAYIRHEPFTGNNQLFLINESHVYTVEAGALVGRPIQEGVSFSPSEALFTWSDIVEDEIIDMFKAVGKALELYSDEPGKAYKQGFAEGEAKVLREWNAELKEQAKDIMYERDG